MLRSGAQAITAHYTYVQGSGQARAMDYKVGTASLRRQDYLYDVFGNLTERKLNHGIDATPIARGQV